MGEDFESMSVEDLRKLNQARSPRPLRHPCETCGNPSSGRRCEECWRNIQPRYRGSLPTQFARKFLVSQIRSCQWPRCQLGSFDEADGNLRSVCEHLPRQSCEHPRYYVCARCLRGLTHEKCNREIARFDAMSQTYGVHPNWESEVVRYLQFGSENSLWLPDSLVPEEPS